MFVIRKAGRALRVAVLAALAGLFLLPVVVMLTNSFMSDFEIVNRYTAVVTPQNGYNQVNGVHFAEMGLIPFWVSLKQYGKLLFESPQILGLFWNSVQLAVPILLGQLAVSSTAAYYFHISKAKRKETLFFVYIVIMLMPMQVALVPNYIVADFLRINNSYWAIILPAVFNPFGAFLIRQYLNGMSPEIVEAARLDGAGHFGVFRYVVLPLLKPAIAALAILTFIDSWNIVDQAVVFIREPALEPLSVYLSRFRTSGMDVVFAVSCFYMLPTIFVFLYGQEELTSGISHSVLK